MFSCEFCKISKNTFFTEHLWATAFVRSLAKTHYSRPICNSDIAKYGFLTVSLVKTRSMFMGAMQIVLDERSEKEFIKTKIWYDYINHDISLPQNVRLL